MADISMCSNDVCAKRKNCYRYTAIHNPYYQAYAIFSNDKEGCEYFWDNSKKRNANIDSPP